jgi:hypothetical protein
MMVALVLTVSGHENESEPRERSLEAQRLGYLPHAV